MRRSFSWRESLDRDTDKSGGENALIPNVSASEYREDRARVDPAKGKEGITHFEYLQAEKAKMLSAARKAGMSEAALARLPKPIVSKPFVLPPVVLATRHHAVGVFRHDEFQRRAERTSDDIDRDVVAMIRAHVGKPCPTRNKIMALVQVPRRDVWVILGEVAERGVIEIEVCDTPPARRRRMRVVGEEWTLWTARRPIILAAQ